MRLVTYSSANRWLPGVLAGEHVLNLNDVLYAIGEVDGPPFDSVRDLLDAAGGRLGDLSHRVAQLNPASIASAGLASELHLGPPVADPKRRSAVGLNYSDHVERRVASSPIIPTSSPSSRAASSARRRASTARR